MYVCDNILCINPTALNHTIYILTQSDFRTSRGPCKSSQRGTSGANESCGSGPSGASLRCLPANPLLRRLYSLPNRTPGHAEERTGTQTMKFSSLKSCPSSASSHDIFRRNQWWPGLTAELTDRCGMWTATPDRRDRQERRIANLALLRIY